MMKRIFLFVSLVISLQSSSQHKLEILDFWATWCSSCIKEFPKLVELQQKFPKDLRITLVNSKSTEDDLKSISAFKANWEAKNGNLSLHMINVDESLTMKYPHQGIPHYVWLVNGEVFAITGPDQVSAEHISSVIRGEPFVPIMKHEMSDEEKKQPLYLSSQLPKQLIGGYSVFIKAVLSGLPRGYTWNKNARGIVVGIRITNANLADAYRFTAAAYLPELMNRKRTLVDLPDSVNVFVTSKTNLICFDHWGDELGSLSNPRMLNSLNALTGLKGQIRNVMTDCLVLVGGDRLGKVEVGKPAEGDRDYESLSDLVEALNANKAINLPVVDETGIVGPVQIRLRKEDAADKASLELLLRNYGLHLKSVRRELEMLILEPQ